MGTFLFADGSDTANTESDDSANDDDDATNGEGASNANSGADAAGNLPKTQAELDAVIERRLKRERKKVETSLRDSLKDEIRAELASQRGEEDKDAKIAKLTKDLSKLERLSVLAEVAEEEYDDEVEALPDHIKQLAPDDDADIIEKQAWLRKARKAARQWQDTQKAGDGEAGDDKAKKAKPGNKANDPANRNADKRSAVDKLMDEAKRSSLYRSLT